MPSGRLARLALTLGLATGACAHPPGPVAPVRAFATTADALDCARTALASAGFLVEPRRFGPGADAAMERASYPPNTVEAVLLDPVDGRRNTVRATALVRVGPRADTSVVLKAEAVTLSGLSSRSNLAKRGRDSVVAQCIRP